MYLVITSVHHLNDGPGAVDESSDLDTEQSDHRFRLAPPRRLLDVAVHGSSREATAASTHSQGFLPPIETDAAGYRLIEPMEPD